MTSTTNGEPAGADFDDRFELHVEALAVLLFARALGYPDGTYAAGDAVPPTFLQAAAHIEPNYPLDTTRPGWIDKRSPRYPGVGRSLHAEQTFRYHHPIRVGDVLTVTIRTGRQWDKPSRRGGSLRFVEQITTFHNQHGVLCADALNLGALPQEET